MPLLAFREVVAGYAQPVIGPVSFALEPGEALGLFGPNGVGKSTLFRAITGEARVWSGEIARAPGLTVAHHAQHPVRPQETPLTGHDLLAMTGADRRACPEPLRALLGQRLDRLSGGQFQLVHTWACLGGPAALVLLDEPTGNLDREAESLLRAMILDRERSGRAVLLVSHDADFLEAVCTRVMHLFACAPERAAQPTLESRPQLAAGQRR